MLRNAETVLNDGGTSSFIPNKNIFPGAFLAGLAVYLVLFPVFKAEKKEANHAE